MTKYNELVEQAIQELNINGELFVRCVDELDSWNGYADGFRCFEMDELDELCCGMKISDFIEKLYNFNSDDIYFQFTIWGITSVNDKESEYRNNVDEGELLDNLISNYYDLDIEWIDSDFNELVKSIVEYRESEQAM